MITLALSNGTRLDVSLDFKTKSLVVTQTPATAQQVAPELMANNRLTIPLADLKTLASSVKTLVGFFT